MHGSTDKLAFLIRVISGENWFFWQSNSGSEASTAGDIEA